MVANARLFAVTALVVGGLLSAAPPASAAQVYTPQPAPAPVLAPASTQPLDCAGTTGSRGCGPGWFWRDGWRGFGCYPC